MKTVSTITISFETIKNRAISAMENCMAYISIGDRKKASEYYGEACTWDEILLTGFHIVLAENDDHYADMLAIWDSETLDW